MQAPFGLAGLRRLVAARFRSRPVTFLFDNTANATFANMMSGAGIFRKAGSGQLSFTNAFSIGALAVDAGRVRVNSTVTTNATIASGATLDGTRGSLAT